MLVVFESGVALGMVRLFIKRTIARLRAVLSHHEKDGRNDQIFDRHFQTLLGEELERSLKAFGEKNAES